MAARHDLRGGAVAAAVGVALTCDGAIGDQYEQQAEDAGAPSSFDVCERAFQADADRAGASRRGRAGVARLPELLLGTDAADHDHANSDHANTSTPPTTPGTSITPSPGSYSGSTS